MYELDGYSSRYFSLKRMAIESPAGPAKDRLIAPEGWSSGRTAKGSSWIAAADERYVVQIAATESDLEGDGSAQRRELLASLHQRYGADAAVRQVGGMTFFEATSEVPGGPKPALARTLVRIWPQAGQLNMLQFHVVIGQRDWNTPEAEDVIELFRAQLFRASTTRSDEATAGSAATAANGMPSFVPVDEFTRRLGPLKTVSLDGYRFRIPHDWDTGRDDNGAAWAASPSRDYALERKVRVLPAGPDWRGTVKRRAAEIMRDLTGQDISGQLASAGDLERMFALQIPVERSDHAGFKVWHWPQLVHIDGVIVEAWLSLHVRQNLWHASGTEDLEQLLGQQFTEQPPGDPRRVGSAKAGFGLDRKRPFHAFGFVGLDLPERWYDEFDAQENMWVAGEDEPDTGTLWIRYDVYGGDVDALTVEAFAQPVRANGGVERPTPHAGRKLLYETSTAREKGEMLRFHRWALIERRGNEIAIVHFTLVIGQDQETLPDFVALVRSMECEIAAARLGPFPN